MNQLTNCLVLADGTVFEGSSCGFAEKSLWCWISNRSMAECFAIFNDPNKTNTITMYFTTSGVVYTGFTEIDVIRRGTDVFGNETIDIRLRLPEGGNHSVMEFDFPRETEETAEEL